MQITGLLSRTGRRDDGLYPMADPQRRALSEQEELVLLLVGNRPQLTC
jgi:hypothetical protein